MCPDFVAFPEIFQKFPEHVFTGIHRPQQYRKVDKHGFIRNSRSNTIPSSESESDMTLFFGVRWGRSHLTIRVQVTCGIEVVRIRAVNLCISIHAPEVRDNDRMLWDEVAIVPIILDRTMWYSKWDHICPSQHLLHLNSHENC